VVHHKELQCRRSQVQYRVLRAGESTLRHLHCFNVCKRSHSSIYTEGTNIFRSLLYFVELCVSIHSCFITPEEREEIIEQREEKKIEKEFEEEILKSPSMIPLTPGPMSPGHMIPGFMPQRGMVPRTPGFPPAAAMGHIKNGSPVSPFTPRTLGFNRLGGSNGSTSSDLPLRDSPSMPTSQMPAQITTTEIRTGTASPMYFPPPPKKASKN